MFGVPDTMAWWAGLECGHDLVLQSKPGHAPTGKFVCPTCEALTVIVATMRGDIRTLHQLRERRQEAK